MKTKPQGKPFTQMSAAELAKATQEFDREFVADSFASPPADAKARWKRARRKRGRPRTGKGVRVISVSVEKSLLRQSDAFAKKQGVSRASLIAEGLKRVLAQASQ